MSEQRLVSPLLDGFAMGEPMSSHDGIHCCPAIRENTQEKYIVKIISVPASQKQLDALLLTGAYPDAASATDYFKELAEGVVKEAELLKQLSKLEGFLAYDNWQTVPMEGSKLGYQVYLISPYKRSLEKYLSRNTMTHLGAVNLGLDLCAALSICRRAGFIHVDLKPANVFMNGKREFRIGDLGFVKLNALKYTSLPSKYCSRYTPPELHDPLNTLNPTADIYAVGMILYQIYNNGQIPYADKAPDAPLPAPLNADYEMAEIILKACDPNPRKRWQTPIEMGQALVAYMKRNSPTDASIIPPAAQPGFMDAAYEPAAEQQSEAAAQPTASGEAEEISVVPANDPLPDEADAAPDVTVEEADTEADVEAVPEIEAEQDALPESDELDFMAELASDETAPDEQNAEELVDTILSDDISSMLAQADELLAPPEVSMDPPEAEEAPVPEEAPQIAEPSAEQEEEEFDFEKLLGSVAVADPAPAPKAMKEEPIPAEFTPRQRRPRKKHGFLKFLVTLLVLGGLAFGGYYYYQNYYLLHIGNLAITPFENTLTVTVDTEADEALLKVVCTDTYGNTASRKLDDGKAVFTDLAPGTLYKIELAVEGFHDLKGSVTGTATTADKAEILEFTAINGTEDGSVILNFTASGPEQDWILEYSAADEELQTVSFTGHMVTVTGLTVGKTYTFRLVTAPGADIYIVGNDTLEIVATKNIVAEKLAITSCENGVLTAQWSAPADTAVDSWTVRCYNDSGYDESITVTETSARFENIAADTAYTVEVTAAGMTLNARAYISANPATITDIAMDNTVEGKLTVTWNSGSVMPEGGWLLMYTLDNGNASMVIKCSENKAVIEPTVPGATYHLTIQPADGSTVFGGKHSCSVAGAAVFNDKSINGAEVTGSFCPTPSKSGWTYKDIADDAYTATYAPGSKVSMVLYSPDKADRSNDSIQVMFVIRDSEGNPLPNLTGTVTASWNDLWNNRSRYCSLDLPGIPGAAGQYTVEVYFNRQLVITKKLTVTE